MKNFFWLFSLIPLSYGVFAEESTYHSPFVTQYTVSSFTISATTGLSIPFAQPQLSQASALRNTYTALSNQGVKFNAPNYRQTYLKADPYSAQGRIRISETIGDTGARMYARTMNYQPMYQGRPGQGQGFDAVFRHGKQVVVVEAKGGSSQPKIYRGYKQGTLEYTLKVAEYVKNSKTASLSAKASANAVIKAAKEGKLVIQVAKTQHVYGTPEKTQIQTTYGKVDLPSSLSVAHNISVRVGLGGAIIAGIFDVASQWSSGQSINWQRLATTSMLGGISAYAGSMSGIAMQRVLSSNGTALLTKLSSPAGSGLMGSITGGAATAAVFSYGLYFLGYTDLKSANRSMVAGLIGTAAGGLTSGGLMLLATTIGTASTGTAIAGLSGAAATNAAMAWLGGGALSAGGFGVAGGATVLTGGAALVVIAVGGGVMYLFSTSDEETERQRVDYLIARVSQNLNQ